LLPLISTHSFVASGGAAAGNVSTRAG